MKKLSGLMTVALALAFSQQVMAWGQNGHRIIGQIASNHLTDTTRSAIAPLLGGDLLAEVTTWPDEMRSNPAEFWQKDSPRWHYINAESPEAFTPEAHRPQHRDHVEDLYGAMMFSITALQSTERSLEERQFYFRFLTHLVGDVHQPMHTGKAEDRGGNAIDVTFFGQQTNLHSLWDTGLIESQNLSFSEYARFIDTRDLSILRSDLQSGPSDWVRESMKLSQAVYDYPEKTLGYRYVYEQMPVVEERLRKGGIRLAGLLNALFDPKAEAGRNAIPKSALQSAAPKSQ